MNASTLGRAATGLAAALLLALPVAGVAWIGTASAEPGETAAEHRADASQDGAGDSADHSAGNAGTTGDPTQPQPASNADFSGSGANVHGPYDSTRDGSPSANGEGDGAALGKPCAGCVGKADNKNPSGQLPGGSDPNAGYECDRNKGIGKTNPAHTSCQEQPPGEQPPGERPPGERPPGERPPGERPPGEQPPGEQPPADQPGVPPGEELPKTGADPARLLAAAVALLLTGAALMVGSTRS